MNNNINIVNLALAQPTNVSSEIKKIKTITIAAVLIKNK